VKKHFQTKPEQCQNVSHIPLICWRQTKSVHPRTEDTSFLAQSVGIRDVGAFAGRYSVKHAGITENFARLIKVLHTASNPTKKNKKLCMNLASRVSIYYEVLI